MISLLLCFSTTKKCCKLSHKSLLGFFFLLCSLPILNAQEALENTETSLLLEKISLHSDNYACDSVLFYAEQLFEIHAQKDLILVEGLTKSLNCLKILGLHQEALQKTALLEAALAQVDGEILHYFTLHRVKALTYMSLDSVSQSVPEFELALEYAQQSDIKRYQFLVNYDFSLLYFLKFKELEKALDHMQEALRINTEVLEKDSTNINIRNQYLVLNNIGGYYHEFGVYDSVKYYYDLSNELMLEHSNIFSAYELGLASINRSLLLFEQDEIKEAPKEAIEKALEEAIEEALKANRYAKESGDPVLIYNSIANLVEAYLKLEQFEKAISLKDNLIQYGESLNDPSYQMKYYLLLSKIIAIENNVQNVFDYFNKAILLKDSIHRTDLESDLNVLEAKYEFDLERKELAYQQLLNENKIQSQRNYMLLFSLLLLAALAIVGLQIRNRKKLQGFISQLSEREQALSLSNKRLNRFSDSISHDIANKLDYLLAFGNSKIENKSANIEQFSSFYEENKATIVWLKEYCRDLLLWSKKDISLDLAHSSDLQIIVESVLNSHEYELEQRQFDLEIEDLPTVAMAEAPLTQILENLISNSLKHSKKSDAPQLRISAKQDQNKWVIGVEDNGVGVVKASRDDIFKKSKNSEEHGKGLGFVKSILEEHGETIWVTSNEWGGASFYFTTK